MSNLKNTLVLITKYIIVMLVLYFMYYSYNKLVESQKNAPILVKNTHNGKIPKTLKYKPLSLDGNGYSLMFWMKLTDPSWNANKWRHVLHKGHTKIGREAQPGIWLEPKTNNMIIRYKTSEKIGLYDVEPNSVLNSYHDVNKEYIKALRNYEKDETNSSYTKQMEDRLEDFNRSFDTFTDKTVEELKEIDRLNGKGGIFFLAKEEEIEGDFDNFKPEKAYVWKPVTEGSIPKNVHSIDKKNATLPARQGESDDAGYTQHSKIPITLIFRGINSISPDDTVAQCKSKLTHKECCDRVQEAGCVKTCPIDLKRNKCLPGDPKIIDYETHANNNCKISQDVSRIKSNCVLCKGSGSGTFTNDKGFMKYETPSSDIVNPRCFIKTDTCPDPGDPSLKPCHRSSIVGGKIIKDDRNFSTHVKNIPINRWFHVSICVDDQTASVHIDGKLVSSSAFPNSVVDNDGILWLSQNGGFGGHLTQVRTYNKVVSQEIIEQVYELGPEPLFQLPDISNKIKEITGQIPKPNIEVTWER